MQNLEITKVTDQSLAGNGAEALFKFRVRQGNQVNYRQETTYNQLLIFQSGEVTCRDDYCRHHDCYRYGYYDYYDHDCGYWGYWDSYLGMCVNDYYYYNNYDSCGWCGSNQYCDNGVCRYYGYYYDSCDYCDYSYQYCDDGVCRSRGYYSGACYDSDGGADLYTYGYATNDDDTLGDYCTGSYTLREAYCDSYGDVQSRYVDCPDGCSDGRCMSGASSYCSSTLYCQSLFDSNYYCNDNHQCVYGPSSSCSSTSCCQSRYGSNYYYSNGQCVYQGSGSPSGGYQCSANEYICGWPCSSYYYIDATCGSLMKSRCSAYGLNYLNPYSSGAVCVSKGTPDYCTLSSAIDSYGRQTYQIGRTRDVDSWGNPTSGTSNFCKNDPPVTCSAYLSGPGLSRTNVGTFNYDTLPSVDYPGTVSIGQSYFGQQGTYSLDVSCNIDLPSGSVACSPGCTSAGSTVNFHVETCNTAVSVETDKAQYASGEMMTIRGTLRNNNLPIGTTVYVRVQDLLGNTRATIPVAASGGEFSTNWIVPNTLATGSYRINATAQFNACAQAQSNVVVGIASCDITVTSTLSQHGSASAATVTGNVYNRGTSLSGANVTVKIFKDGSLFKQGYTGSLLDGTYSLSIPGPFGEGTYTAQVDAKYMTCPAVSAYASGTTTFTGACDVRLVNGAARFSSTVSGVQVTGFLADSAGARATGTYEIEVRNKAGSVIGTTSGSTSSSGEISATIANIAAGDYDVVVKTQAGGCSNTDKLSLGGDFQVSLLSSPACGTASSTYQVKLKNGQQSSMTVYMTYSSASQVILSGPSSVVLPAGGESVISVNVAYADSVSGGSLGVVNFNNSNAASSQALELPICASGNLRVTPVDRLRIGSPGQRLCYAIQVENRGPESGTVTLSYDAGPYYVDGSFSLQQFRISSYETRDDLSFCATVPNAQFYTLPIVVRANAPFGTASDTVAVSSGAATSDISVGFSGCPNIAKGMQFPITLYNNGETANYAVEITDNGYLHPIVTPQVINRFSRYSSQVVTVSVDPTGLLAANYVTLYIRKDGAVVRQQQLCFATVAAVNASSQYSSSLYAVNRSALAQPQPSNAPDVTIYAPQIDYTYNGTHFVANASFLVRNNEDRALLYEANVNLPEGWEASYYPRAATIRPNDMREFTVAMSTSSFQNKVYAGSIAMVDPIGRTASAPFSIDATRVTPGTGTLTGFFSAAGISGYAAAIIVLLAIGAVLFYGIRRHEETAA
jgi:hypothetical protein